MKIGDLVRHKTSWKGYLFVITDIDDNEEWLMCRCAIVRTPKPEAEYEVGYIIRWKPRLEWELYKK